MKKDKKKNRFINFFSKKRRFFSFILYVFSILGVAFIFLFFLEFYFALNSAKEKIIINEDMLGGIGELNFRHHPYLDYIHDYQPTKNPCESEFENPVEIYMYGGSTMMGGNRDESIPFYLWEFLCSEGFNVEVKNFGQAGYLSSQEIFTLIHQLRMGMNPDIVIFYDGYNDMGVKVPGYPHMYLTKQVFGFFAHHKDYPFSHIASFTHSLLSNLGITEKKTWEKMEEEIVYIDYFSYDFINEEHNDVKKYERVMEVYLENVRIIGALENNYGFQAFFYWQPDITTKEDYSKEEKKFMKKYPSLISYYKNSEETVSEFLSSSDRVKDLRQIFDGHAGKIYSDSVHKQTKGNRIVAEEMARDVMNYLEN